MILSIDAVNDILDEMAEGFPAVLFEELNGGVNLLEEAMPDPEFPEGEMYFLGETTAWGATSTSTTGPSRPSRSGRTGARRTGGGSCGRPWPTS